MKKYLELHENLLRMIQDGSYPAGEKLPTEEKLSELGYSRNTVRQALAILESEGHIQKRRGSGSVVLPPYRERPRCGFAALLFSDFNRYIFSDAFSGITDALAGFASPIMYATKWRFDEEARILDELSHREIDGVVVQGYNTALPNPNYAAYQRLIEKGVPVVFLFSCPAALTGVSYVGNDDAAGGYQAVSRLVERGCRRIGGVFVSEFLQGHRRYEGFIRACNDYGIEISRSNILWVSERQMDDRVCLEPMFAKSVHGVDGLVCFNDWLAKNIIEYCTENKLLVPQDVAVISFDNSFISEYSSVPISSFDGNAYKVGFEAGKIIKEGRSSDNPVRLELPWTFVKRASC